MQESLDPLESSPAAARPFIRCRDMRLPQGERVKYAQLAADMNPTNGPPDPGLNQLLDLLLGDGVDLDGDGVPDAARRGPQALAAVTRLMWPTTGVVLPTGFMDAPSNELRDEFLRFLNLWHQTARISFAYSAVDPTIRIARQPGAGYYSYLGVENLGVPQHVPTMNFDSFTLHTPRAEWDRVVPHEAGHALGFTHEHLRPALVDRINPRLAAPYYRRTQGWNARTTRSNVLTPEDESQLTATPRADQESIMAYWVPGEITYDGLPILGGARINDRDYAHAAKCYPKPAAPPKPAGNVRVVRVEDPATGELWVGLAQQQHTEPE